VAVGQRDPEDHQSGGDKARSKQVPGSREHVTEMDGNGSIIPQIDTNDRPPGSAKRMNRKYVSQAHDDDHCQRPEQPPFR